MRSAAFSKTGSIVENLLLLIYVKRYSLPHLTLQISWVMVPIGQ